MIEIIARETCPTCNGTGKWEQQTVLGPIIGPCHVCDEETRTVPRVLATFADAAALREAFYDTLELCGPTFGENIADALTRRIGVSDDHA